MGCTAVRLCGCLFVFEFDECISAGGSSELSELVPHKLFSDDIAERLKELNQMILSHALLQIADIQRLLTMFGQKLTPITTATAATATAAPTAAPTTAPTAAPTTAPTASASTGPAAAASSRRAL
jgi:hypothetical protein